MTGIYKISSLTTKKLYIGSAKNFRYRKNKHWSALFNDNHHNIKLQNHVNKYGIEDLIFEILEETTIELLLIREQFYIDMLKPEFNICPTAGNASGRKWSSSMREKMAGRASFWKGKKLSEETRRRMSASQKGKPHGPHSQETKQKLSNIGKGKTNASGHKVSAESRLIMSNLKKGKPSPRLGVVLSTETKQKMREARLRHIKKSNIHDTV